MTRTLYVLFAVVGGVPTSPEVTTDPARHRRAWVQRVRDLRDPVTRIGGREIAVRPARCRRPLAEVDDTFGNGTLYTFKRRITV